MRSMSSLLAAVASAALLALSSSASFAQEENESSFNQRVDSIVQHVFDSIDNEYQTRIFSQEPAVEESTDNSATDVRKDKTAEEWTDHSTHYSYSYHSSSSAYTERFNKNTTLFYPWENTNDNLLFRYNRVEGLFLGLNDPKTYSWDAHRIKFFGSGGYGFASHRWRYSGAMAEQFGTG